MERVTGLKLPSERCFPAISRGPVKALRRLAYKASSYAPAMALKVERLGASLIHAHFEDGGIQALPLARRLDLPLLTTCHGADVTVVPERRRANSLKRRWHDARRQQLLETGVRFIAVSNHIRERMLERGYPADRLETHYIGVDTELFSRNGAEAEDGLVLFVGRLVEKKGCAHLIKAMAMLRQKLPRARLVVIGDGPLRVPLEGLARAEDARCEFLGLQPPEAVKQWLNRATLLAAPSVTAANGDTEGLPLVVCEAQSMGLPVVGFRHAGIPEAVIHGYTGLLCPEQHVEELSENLACVLADETLSRRLGTAARQRMCEKFDLRLQTAKLESIYDATVQGRSDLHPAPRP